MAGFVDGDNLPKMLSKEATWAELCLRFQQWDRWDSVAISKPKCAQAGDGLVFISSEVMWAGRRKKIWNYLKMSHWDVTRNDVRPAQLQRTHSYKHLLRNLKLEALKTYFQRPLKSWGSKADMGNFYFLCLFFMEDHLYSFLDVGVPEKIFK
jgi:hypothetical protein